MAAVMYKSCLKELIVLRNASSFAVGGVRRCLIRDLSRSVFAMGRTLFSDPAPCPSDALVMTAVTSNGDDDDDGWPACAWISLSRTEAATSGVPKKAIEQTALQHCEKEGEVAVARLMRNI